MQDFNLLEFAPHRLAKGGFIKEVDCTYASVYTVSERLCLH